MSPRLEDFDPVPLIARLTDRDFTVLDLLARHKIATTAILRAICFPSRRSTNLRLRTLSDLALVRRCLLPGSGMHRFVLDWKGQTIWAIRQGERPPTRREANLAIQRILFSAHRTHKEEVNEFFASLHLAAREAGDVTVTEWRNEAEAAATGLIGVRPDAAGTLTWNDSRELRFWYEHDRGTETLTRQVETVERYRTGLLALTQPRLLLIGLPSRGRLDHFLTAARTAHGLTVAAHLTAPLPPVSTPPYAMAPFITGARWHVLGDPHPHSLVELASNAAT